MNKNAPIIVLEDDADDRDLLNEVFKQLDYPNKILFFENGQLGLDYLLTTTEVPFLILSDINMPKLNGMDLRKQLKLDAALQLKCIPYLFFTTAINKQMVVDAYSESAQGFFVKPSSFDEIKETISDIIRYWKRCAAPNNF